MLVELDGVAAVLALYAALRDDPVPGVTRMVPGARTVLVSFDAAATTGEQVRTAISGRPLTAASPTWGPTVTVPVRYDGPDLPDVARLTGLSAGEVVARHAAGRYVATFAGYVPGWSYLVGLDPSLHVPRRSSPRTKVPAGSVAVAGELTGVYPGDAPGGWHLIGRTDLPMWDLDRDPPALLAYGTQVSFVELAP